MRKINLFTLFLVIVLNSLNSFSQATKRVEHSNNNKYGLYEFTNDTVSKIILPTIYKGHEYLFQTQHHLLFQSNSQEQGNTIYNNIVLLDSNFNIVSRFDKISHLHDSTLIIIGSEGYSLYDFKNERILIKDKVKIFIPQYSYSKNTTNYYMNSVGGPEDTYPKLIAIWENGKTSVLDWDNHHIVTVNGYENVTSGVTTETKYNRTTLNFIGIGSKTKSLYSYSGDLVLNNIKNIHAILFNSFNYNTPYVEVTSTDGTLSLFENSNLVIKNTEGEEFLDITHPNKLILKRKDGFVVYDSLGKRYNNVVYQTLLKPSKYQEWRGKQYVNIAQLNNEWFFVDSLYKPLNENRYYSAQALITGDFEIIKSKETKKEHFLFNCFGELVTEEPLDFINEYFLSEDYFLTLHKNNRTSLYYSDQIKTDFIYYNIRENCIGDDFVKGYKNNEVVLIDLNTGNEFFTGKGFKRFQCIGDDSYESEIPWTYQAFTDDPNHFSIAIITWKTDTTKSGILYGNDKFEELNFDENLFYNTQAIQLKKNGKWGVVSSLEYDSTIIPFIYDEPVFQDDDDLEFADVTGYYKVKQNGKIGLLNTKNYKLQLPCEYDDIFYLDEYIITKKEKYYGVLNPYSKITEIIPPILTKIPSYNFIANYEPITAEAVINNEKSTCFMTEKGLLCFNEVKLPKNSESENIYVKINNFWGAVNSYRGDTLVQPEYSNIEIHPNYDYFLVEKNERHGICDYYGKPVLECIYDELIPFQGDTYDLVKLDGKWGAFQNGNEVIPIEFEELIYKNESFYFKKNGLWGCLDFYGRPVLEAKYKSSKKLEEALRGI